MAYKALNQESANVGDQTLPTACSCKQSIIGTLPHPRFMYCLWLFPGRAESLLQRLRGLKHPQLALYKVSSLLLSLICTSSSPLWQHLYSLPHSLCSNHSSLLTIPQVPWASSHYEATAHAALFSQGCSCPGNCNASLCNPWVSLFSCHFRETFPNHTILQISTPAPTQKTPHISTIFPFSVYLSP